MNKITFALFTGLALLVSNSSVQAGYRPKPGSDSTEPGSGPSNMRLIKPESQPPIGPDSKPSNMGWTKPDDTSPTKPGSGPSNMGWTKPDDTSPTKPGSGPSNMGWTPKPGSDDDTYPDSDDTYPTRPDSGSR